MTRPAAPKKKPTPAANLLAQRPHTSLPGDVSDDYADYDVSDTYDQFFSPATTSEDQDQNDNESALSEAREQYAELMEDAAEDEMDITDFQRYWRRLKSHMEHTLESHWRIGGPHLDTAMDCGTIVRAAQETGSDLTQLYAARGLGVKFRPFIPNDSILERPGASKLEVYSRPMRENSLGQQLKRLGTLSSTDLQLAKTRTLFSAFDEDMTVNRAPVRAYRRNTESEHPCALCLIASTQLYFTTDLMPIHDNCMCDVEMADESEIDEHEARYHHLGFVDKLLDTGQQVKAIQTLADADADIDDYVNLTKIEQHGELGPVIRWAGQKFTGPHDLPDPRGIRPVPTISGPGAGHEARLQRNAARTAQIRRQRGHSLHYAEGHGGLTTYLPPTPKVTKPIPKREPKTAKVIPIRAEAKRIDFQHDTTDDIVDAMAEKYGSHPPVSAGQVGAFGPEWKDPQYNEDTKRAMLQAFDEILTKYPEVHINRIEIEDAHGDWAGLTGYNTLTKGADFIKIDAKMMRMSPEEMKAAWSRFHDRFHFDSAKEDPARYLVFHEFGHALDGAGDFVARGNAEKLVSQAFTKTGQWVDVDPKTMTPGQMNKTVLDNQDRMRKWMGEQLSGYSMIDGYLPDQINPETERLGRMGLAKAEALAQAFSDVEIRGDKATDVSKMLHEATVSAARHPIVDLRPPKAAAAPRPAVDRLRELTEPKPNWTAAAMKAEDNHSKDAAGHEILNNEQRALARQLATTVWTDGAKVEPAITAAAVSSAKSLGGFMSGLDFRQKTGPSLYRKIQAEAIELAHGEPVDDDDLRAAAKGIKDAVRYTAVMPEDGYWQKGDQLRRALESLGAKTIKDPVGIPLHGYRGRNMAFELNGMPFEMQVHTELGVAIKDEAHQIYNVSRKLKADLEAKGKVAEDDPVYAKMLADMQAKWDSMPMLKGTPIVQTEKDAKSGDPDKVIRTQAHTAYVGPSVPGGEAALHSAEMESRARVPTTQYGMDWLPDSPEAKIVAPARAISDDLWNTLPVEHISPDSYIKANEGTLKKKSIDKVVSGREPFREGYVIKLLRTDDGVLHVVDGHTRIAMYHALDKDMPVRIMDEHTLQLFSQTQED